jgi:hypothetical protein
MFEPEKRVEVNDKKRILTGEASDRLSPSMYIQPAQELDSHPDEKYIFEGIPMKMELSIRQRKS